VASQGPAGATPAVQAESRSDFIVMEYLAGKTLDQLIGRKGLKLSETLKYAVQVADALAAAHAAGIVHRHLKPANIMVTGRDVVKVLDFGLAKLMQVTAEEAPVEKTIEGTIVGTLYYQLNRMPKTTRVAPPKALAIQA
jgi:serine/threonine-protein kinase